MGRKVSALHRITGELVVEGDLSIGSGREGADADIRVARDGLGRLIIPGESLAGVLLRIPGIRRWDVATTAAPSATPGATSALAQVEASPIWVEDAVASDMTASESRDHGNRDRRSGAAADKGLFTRETVLHGTTFDFQIDVEARAGGEEEAAVMAALIAEHLSAGIGVGARRNAGSGRLVCASPTITTRELGTAAGMLAALTIDDKLSPEVRELLPPPPRWSLHEFRKARGVAMTSSQSDTLTITIPFRALSPLLASVATEGVARMVPAMELRPDGWRGRIQFRQGLRVIAERIERTMAGGDDPAVPGQSTQFETDLLDGRCELTKVIFGSQGGQQSGGAGAWRQAPVRTASAVVAADEWRQVLGKQGMAESDDRPHQKLTVDLRNALKPTCLRLQEHIQIESWSGAPLDKHLFGIIAIEPDVAWEAAVATIDLGGLATVHTASEDRDKVTWHTVARPEQVPEALALILLTLREAASGELGLGYGTSRGLGEISIDPDEITFAADSSGPASALDGRTLHEVLADAEVLRPFQEAWTRHIEHLKQAEAERATGKASESTEVSA